MERVEIGWTRGDENECVGGCLDWWVHKGVFGACGDFQEGWLISGRDSGCCYQWKTSCHSYN
jgi:hypothetical protein